MDPDGVVDDGVVHHGTPSDTKPRPAAVCPKCKGPAELRVEDNARHCRTCDLTFYHAAGWPDILDVLDERET